MRTRTIVVMAMSTLWCLATTGLGSPVIWETADGGNGHAYEAVAAPAGITWTDALYAADAMGGYLATVHGTAENNFIFDNLIDGSTLWNGAYGPWLGGYQLPGFSHPGDGWVWATGEDWNWNEWYPGAPYATAQRFLHYYHDYRWSNSNESAPVQAFIVEYIPEPATLWLLVLGAVGLKNRKRPR